VGPGPRWTVIVVATADFELYHEMVTALRERGIAFRTVELDEEVPDETDVLVVGEGERESIAIPEGVEVIEASPDKARRAVEAVTAVLRGEGGRTIVGIDPGDRPGIAVLSGERIVATFQVPADRAADVVRDEVVDAENPVVRLGDGARLVGARVLDDLPDVPVELVDETGTTPYLGAGTRGMGDVLAAVNIARLEGERVESREIEPTDGEIQRIKDRSRETSDANRAIDADLARQVAAGNLSIEEALARHRDT